MNQQKTDRRVQRTRQIIRDALVALMLEKSYEKITVQDIIDRANVGRATFYNHYQDKDDLLLRGVAGIVYRQEDEESILESQQQSEDMRPSDTIQTAGMFRHSRQNRRVHQVMFKRSRENPILEKMTAFLYTRVEKQLTQLAEAALAPPVPIPVMAQFITGGLLSIIRWWHDNDFPYTAAEMDEFFQQVAMPGTLKALGQRESVDTDD
jgi:AcrR family transcriptional regulator